MQTRRFAIALLVCSMAAAGISASDAAEENGRLEHPLIGSVWTGNGDAASSDTLFERAAAVDFILVGETHPNPEHHLFQVRMVAEMASRGRKPAVVFEMVPRADQDTLDAFNAASAPDTAALGEALRWTKRGWPDWAIYKPIADAAAANGLPLFGGGVDRRDLNAAAKTDEADDNMQPGTAQTATVVYSATQDSDLVEELKISHCNLLPDKAIEPMLSVQKARDLSMATAMIEFGADTGSILVAGNGHVRKDWGIPFVLAALAPDANTVSVAQFEVQPDAIRFEDYADNPDGTMPFDFVVFTELQLRDDPCEGLALKLGKGADGN